MSINPMAAAGGLSRGDQAELQKFLELHNTKDALINLNSMTAHCFDKCISSGSGVRSKNLDDTEKKCLESCTLKYMACLQRSSFRLTEYQLEKQGQGQQPR